MWRLQVALALSLTLLVQQCSTMYTCSIVFCFKNETSGRQEDWNKVLFRGKQFILDST
jgi:hypothetical protein